MSNAILYKDLDFFPLRAWNKLNDSISKGSPNWSYMFKDGVIDEKLLPEAQQTYSKLIESLKKVNLSLSLSWGRFTLENSKLRIKKAINLYNDLQGQPKEKILYDKAESLLND
jgi:hypothetical protein